MADRDRKAQSRFRYYTPATAIREVAAVVHRQGARHRDSYIGTAEDLSAAGLLPLELFPGQPGMNTVSAAWRPVGQKKHAKFDSWQYVPGYLEVTRRPDGRFRIVLTVSEEEQVQRGEAEETMRKAADAAHEAVLLELPRGVRLWTEQFVAAVGGLWAAETLMRDRRHLAAHGISFRDATLVLDALEAMRRANDERRLRLQSIAPQQWSQARAIIERVRSSARA